MAETRSDQKHTEFPFTQDRIVTMFSGYTAWFSSSVQETKKNLWLKNGGRKETFEKADYIFSEDAECEDTSRVFECEAYLDEHLSVFHPAYITSCVKHQSMNKVSIGKYFFPPTEIQTFIKKQGRQLGWEMSDGEADYNDQDIFDEDPRESQNRQRLTTTTTKQNTDKRIVIGNKNLSRSPKPGSSNQKSSRLTDSLNDTENQVADRTVADSYPSRDRHNQINGSCPRETKRDSEGIEHDGNNPGVSNRKKSKFVDKSEKESDIVQVNDHVESVNINRNNDVKRTTNKWKGFDVLRIKDLNKMMGDFITFEIGKGGCEMINLDEK